ncbi:hypothetical protein [Dietzia sp. 179-F 9C3 NHS]|uniref:hypothetical protein n=1 Tax=Dietzia sp. 179-F 9C3 NHS TaxID=3374295 RepID=UPI0038791AF0
MCGRAPATPTSGAAQPTYPDLLRIYATPTVRIPAPPVPWNLVANGLARMVPQDPTTVAALVESLRHDMVCEDLSAAAGLVPAGGRWTGPGEAIRAALEPVAPPPTARRGR